VGQELHAAHALSDEQYRLVVELSMHLDEMNQIDDPALWTDLAVATDARWEKARLLASSALAVLD
jgi:hypothetical protein